MKTILVVVVLAVIAVAFIAFAVKKKSNTDKLVNKFPANESKEKRHNQKPV